MINMPRYQQSAFGPLLAIDPASKKDKDEEEN